MIRLTERDDAILLSVRVVPRARRDSIEGEFQGALKVRVTAPPVDDRANEALCRLLAARLDLPASAVRIVSGEKNRSKIVSIRGATAARVQAIFEKK
jgi:uncharacterized protein (TIGR00251 family)